MTAMPWWGWWRAVMAAPFHFPTAAFPFPALTFDTAAFSRGEFLLHGKILNANGEIISLNLPRNSHG